MKLTEISYIKSIMEKYGLAFQKRYGQNFLLSENVLYRIAEDCSPNVLEIGPGLGSLTYALSECAERVLAIEIDSGLIRALDETLADCSNVKIINGDIMEADLPALIASEFNGGEVSVCANLPYYITTPVIMRLLECGVRFSHITVMIQKEVAQRLTAPAGSSEYGAVTAAVNWYGSVRTLFYVPAGNFMPAPKVDSAVIRITPHTAPPCFVSDEKLLFSVIRAAFAQRRKTLVNSLMTDFSHLGKDGLQTAVVSCGFSPDIRGERLSVSDFAALANRLYEIKS